MAQTNRLDAKTVKSLIDKRTEGKHSDGEGLRLEIKGGSALWVFAFSWEGVQRFLTLGDAHVMSLKDARALRKDLRTARDAGVHPREKFHEGKTKAPTAPPPPVVTLRTDMQAHIVHREGEVKASSNREMVALLERHAKVLLDMDPAKITRAMVLDVVKPLWETKRRSAEKIIAYGRMIWRFSQGETKPNPFGAKPKDLMGKDMLRPGGDPEVTPRAALPWKDLPAFMVALRQREEVEARALELLLLTLCPRTAEVLNAKWEQFDFTKAEWHIPSVKVGWTGRVVPLSEAAMDLLMGMRPIGYRPSDWVFASRVSCDSGRVGRDAMQVMLRVDMGLGATVHGFRSSLLDYVAEQHPMLLMAAERALDHKIGGKVLQAYLRTGMADNRRELAKYWTGLLNAAA